MSHIIKSENDIIEISKLLEKLRSEGCKTEILEEILNTIIPQNSKLPISIVFDNSQKPAFFNEDKQIIKIAPEQLKEYLCKQTYILQKTHPTLKEDIFYNHVLLTLAHEVEHYHQSLIGHEYIDFPYKIVIDSYKNLNQLDISKDLNPIVALIKIKRFLSYSHNPDSLLERNANVESYDLLVKIAQYENNINMLKLLNDLLSYQISLGYRGLYNGSMEKTYKKRGIKSLYESFDYSEEIPTQEKVRYGLPIDSDTRKRVLKKEYKI